MSLDPFNIINYNRNQIELEELLTFSICVQGQKASVTADGLESLYVNKNVLSPFEFFRSFSKENISCELRKYGIYRFYRNKARFLKSLVEFTWSSKLSEVTVEQLHTCPGISFKTANMFLNFTRKEYNEPVLDTHQLKYMREMGVQGVPKSTPTSLATYRRLSEEYKKLVPDGVSLTDFDFEIWKSYATI